MPSMPPFSNQSAGLLGRYSIFQGPARSVLLERVYTIIERDLALWILLDIITTMMVLSLGGVELNPGASYLMSISPAVWIACMIGSLVFYVGSARALNRATRIKIGLLVLIFPILLECYAVVNNVGVLGTML
jgi:hypothetical protein